MIDLGDLHLGLIMAVIDLQPLESTWLSGTYSPQEPVIINAELDVEYL